MMRARRKRGRERATDKCEVETARERESDERKGSEFGKYSGKEGKRGREGGERCVSEEKCNRCEWWIGDGRKWSGEFTVGSDEGGERDEGGDEKRGRREKKSRGRVVGGTREAGEKGMKGGRDREEIGRKDEENERENGED